MDATVRDIIVENSCAVGVRVSNTSDLDKLPPGHAVQVVEIRAKNVVCATSVYNLYNKLLPSDLPVVREFKQHATIRQSNGHVFLFVKIRGNADEINLPNHNLWYFNGYDMDKAFDEYFANPTEVRPPTVYIGFPCTKDTTWKKRLPGVSNCILISDGLWEWFEKWENSPLHHRGADYEAFKAKLSKHLLDILYETVPQVKGKVEYFDLGTPLSEVYYLSSFHGGSYGTMCRTSMFAKENRQWTTTPHTPIKNLFLSGSDAFLPAVCGAMYGGCFGASAVLVRFRGIALRTIHPWIPETALAHLSFSANQGHLGTLKLTLAFISHFAAALREEDPTLSKMEAYRLAWNKFINE